ncbi:MAG: ATP-binding protein [Chloroflexi bacterium]|nr:ATP-binding protein [Chloroflexota bacterium]MYD49668.1 ATP-binding protein [Chloroflexota bacterium]
MPLPGGASDKSGNRYELLWTVVNMAKVLSGEAQSITLEPVGEDGQGVEFVVAGPAATEYHQVKRQRTGRGVWSLSALQAEGVLGNFYQKLEVQATQTVFVSTHAAHPLDELSERACSATSWEGFASGFLASDEWLNKFNDLHQRWGSVSKEESYQRLKRVQVVTISERELGELAQAKLGMLSDADPANAADVLEAFALNQIHQTLTAEDIWRHLHKRGFRQQTWANDEQLANAIAGLNRTYRAGIQSRGIGGNSIRRQETQLLVDYFHDENTRKAALVTGTAGVGKTSVISQVLDEAEFMELPTLSLRVDRLEPADQPETLGKHMGLPASPVRTLAAVAQGRDCLLIIDQLDAVSMASGRNPQFFDCIGAMLEEARHHTNMKVLSACRKFDVDNDSRLRALVSENGIAQEFRVESFDVETVRSLLVQLGFHPDRFSSKQMDLLALPLHMHLLSEAAKGGAVDISALQTTKDLYDAFWRHKRQALQSRGVPPDQMREVVDLVVKHMTDRELLFVPESLLDDHAGATAFLESENILVRDGSRVSFFHESFLDYTFARRMAATGDELAAYILAREQSLFVRSQVRQVLLHRRDGTPGDYRRDVGAILNDCGIRAHLKSIVISLLGALDDPTEDEWRLLGPSLASELSNHVWGSIYGSALWFDLLDTTGVLNDWLNASDEAWVDRAIWLMQGILRIRPDRVAQLLTPFLGLSAAWNRRLLSTVLFADLETSRQLFDLGLALVNSGAADDALIDRDGYSGLWHNVRTLADQNPGWACELIVACCNRLLARAPAVGNTNPFDMVTGPSSSDALGVQQASNGAPRAFIDLLLPFVFDVLNNSADQSKDQPWRDPVWDPEYYANGHTFGDIFLLSMESAIRWLAENDPDAFRQLAGRFQASEFEIIHFLLARGYQANGESFADEAAYYVADALAGFGGHYPGRARWATASLVRAVTPHCSDASLAALEQAILSHYPPFEMTTKGVRYQGSTQFEFLRAVTEPRLSHQASLRLGELRREFPDPGPPGPSIVESYIVQSPIPETSADYMTDEDWLSAMARYHQEYSPYIMDAWIGGARELSRVLESLTRQDPGRFANLAHRMPDDVNPVYFEAILQGLTGSDLSMDQIVQVCFRCHQLPSRPVGRWITRLLVHFPDAVLPDEALEMTAWYATQDPDPHEGSTDYQGDLMRAGINCARGTAADSIAKLIFQDSRYLEFFKPHLETMVHDPSSVVCAMVARALLAALRYDRDFAVQRFVELCEDDQVLSTRFVEEFLKYGVQTHYTDLEPIVVRMLASVDDDVATAGARQSCLASLTIEEALLLGQQCATGSKQLKLGAADVYAANLKVSTLRAECETMLVQLFDDHDADVRKAAAACFRRFNGRDLAEFADLARHYIVSAAFTTRTDPLIMALEETTADVPELIVSASQRFFDLAAEEMPNMSLLDTRSVANLVVRAYSQTADRQIKVRCLDLIDRMHVLGTYGLDRVMEDIDR